MKRYQMIINLNRLLILLFLILSVIVSTGCKKDKENKQDETQNVTEGNPPAVKNDKTNEISISNGSVTEGDEGNTTLKLTVSCSANPRKNSDITVKWSTSDATGTSEAQATAGEDYTTNSGVLTFKKGESLQQDIVVTVKSDTEAEEDELFLVTLEQPVNATIVNSVGEALILNDDNGGTPELSNETKYANLPVGTVIADHFNDFSQKDYNDNAEYSIVSVSGQPFTEAVQIKITTEPSSDSRVNMTIDSPIQLHENDVILASFYARTISPAPGGSSGHLEFLLQHDSDPWTEYVTWPQDIGTSWKRYYIPLTVQVWRGMRSEVYVPAPSDGDDTTFGIGEVRFRFSLGYYPQTIQLADMRIVDYGTTVTGSELPVTLLPAKTNNFIIPGNSPSTGDTNWTPKLLAQAEAGNMYLPDFSYAGYRNGEEVLPTGDGWTVVNVLDYGATPNDETDDTAAIKNAIAAAEKVAGSVILAFPAGKFVISDILIIQRKNFIFRGAGSHDGGTIIAPSKPMKAMTKPPLIQDIEQQIISSNRKTSHGELYSPFSWSGGVIWVGSPKAHGDSGATGTATRTTGTASRGGHTILVDDASNLIPSQVVQLRYYDNSSANPLYDHIFDCTASDLPEGYGASLSEDPEVRQSVTVQSVSGNSVTFKEPLNHDIQEGWHCELKTVNWFSTIGVEGIAIEFPKVNYAGHHVEHGYNAIYLNDALNCWIDDVKITNVDSGILIENSKNVTVSNVIVNGRGGHYSLMATDSDQILFRDFQSDNRSCHSLSFNTDARTVVYTHGMVRDVTFDQHNGMNHQNLLDDLDVRGEVRHLWHHGGASSMSPAHGAFNTAWNLRFIPAGQVPVLGTPINDGPNAYLIGLSSDATLMFKYGPNAYTEGFGRRDIAVPSLYEYQLNRRMQSD
ncbi:glycosyl hydrolase family 28-related protein [Candidatus Electrothrix sp.]|uniref:glycosyl hydrolase family 28-related protein n=1 Tax=Candidatus Electrothrix sp. TaxID=2170559 RepID=UPI004055ABD8